ncbi:MAG: toprim domain-containing protein [Phenylobacterium sp.]
MRKRLPDVERQKIVDLASQELYSDVGKEAYTYLTETRCINPTVLQDFKVGFMPPWVTGPGGKRHEFAGRIIFPLYDQYNNLVAISSRDWKSSDWKFFHEAFPKKYYLYGLNVAKHHIIRNKKVFIVEGEIDTQVLHSNNFKCTVGILGSAPQLMQIAILARYCQEIYLIFDKDRAGDEAAGRIIEIARERSFSTIFGIDLIPVELPTKVDPDDFIKQQGAKNFVKLLKKSKTNYLYGVS